MLTQERVRAYRTEGYVVVENLLSAADVEALRQRICEYTHGGRPMERLRVQVEPRVQRGELAVAHPGDSLRKIDGLVEGDDLFADLGLHSAVADVIEDLLGPDLLLFRNSLMLKPPQVGSQKGWHQDSPYWPVEPMDLCSCWLPLDDATLENGCMVVIPGGHVNGPLPHVHVTDDYVIADEVLDTRGAMALPMPAGAGLFFHSLLPHYTAPNRSSRWRRAMVLSYMRAESRHTGEGEGPEYLLVRGSTRPGCVRGARRDGFAG